MKLKLKNIITRKNDQISYVIKLLIKYDEIIRMLNWYLIKASLFKIRRNEQKK